MPDEMVKRVTMAIRHEIGTRHQGLPKGGWDGLMKKAARGEKLASSIIADMGIHWCVVAAMTDPRNAKRPRACGVIRTWLAEQKAATVTSTERRPYSSTD